MPGIPHLDRLLNGEIPARDVLLLLGAAGTGKTTFCLQVGFAKARESPVCYISTFSEPPAKLLRHIEAFSFYDQTLVGERLHVRNLYSLVDRGLDELIGALVSAVKETGASLLLIDGLASIRDLQPDGVEIRRFIYELGAALAALDCATIVTSSITSPTGHDHLPELTMADGVALLARENLGDRTVRWIEIVKLRGRQHLLGRHSVSIDGNGISISPRIESRIGPSDVGLSAERASFGLAALDEMMGGGPPVGSLTVLAGGPGTGKTLAGLVFIDDGLRNGEAAVILSLRENERQLIDKAGAFGIGLGSPIEEGRLVVLDRPAVDLDVDAIANELVEAIERVDARRLLLDTVGEFEEAITESRRRRSYMTALATILRDHRITSLVTLEVPQVAGPELELSGTATAALAENLVLLRYVEYGGRLVRIVSVLKMRDSPYDSEIRQYEVTDRGLRVVSPEETDEGLLAAISRQPSEARVKRRTNPEDEP